MKKKIVAISTSVVSMLALAVIPAFAHVIVYPHQVGIAAIQDFTVNVPNEKDNPVVSVKLLIPNGLTSVIPYVAPKWTINTKTSGNGDNATITELDWSEGSIPAGQADELRFQAQAPAKQTTLNWKAYQTYSDGTIISWDIDPAKMKNLSDTQQDQLSEKENKGEYSTTSVVNDLTDANMSITTSNSTNYINWLMIMSGGALVLSIVAIGLQMIKKK